MNDIEKIKRRIEKRKGKINIHEEAKQLNNKSESSKIFKCLMGIMTIYVLFMSFAIYAKKDQNGTFLNEIFNTNMNFTNFNKTLNKLLNPRIVSDNNSDIIDQVVSSNVSYIGVGEDYYTSEGNLVVALSDGVITYVNGKDESYTIIVEYDNGIRATYNEVNEVNVFVNDRVYSDDILGSFDDKVHMIFIKDNTKISYEDVVALI